MARWAKERLGTGDTAIKDDDTLCRPIMLGVHGPAARSPPGPGLLSKADGIVLVVDASIELEEYSCHCSNIDHFTCVLVVNR